MNVKDYIPVGEENAVSVRIILSDTTLTGKAWLTSVDATEVQLRSDIDNRLWAIGAEHVEAITTTQQSLP